MNTKRSAACARGVFPESELPQARTECERKARATDGVRFSCLGPARFEKGIDLLQRAVKGLLARRSRADIHFVIQWNEDIRDASGAVYKPGIGSSNDCRVQFLTKPLSTAEYDREIALTDCMLLPYRRSSYFARISGVESRLQRRDIAHLYLRYVV